MKWILGAFIAVAAIVFIILYNLAGSLPENQELSVTQPDAQPELPQEEAPAHYLENEKAMPMECNITPADGAEYAAGIIAPGGRIEVPMDSEASCRWMEFDYEGCINTTFQLCTLAREYPYIRECLQWDIPYQHFCAAFILNNRSLCEPILEPSRRALCFVYQDKDVSYCDELDDTRDWCLKDYALNTGNATVCGMIGDEGQKSECLAIVTKDVDACNRATLCVTTMAQIHHDISLCDKADDPALCRTETNRFI